MGTKWNQQQSEVIAHRDGNLLVSAAAGSGKTAVLTEHVLQRVTDPGHPMDIESLLIMTFTNAAAAEMKDRIRGSLQNALESASCGEGMRQHLRRQLIKLPYASISTIHSFCLNVIRENFFRIGLEPNMNVSDEVETKLLLSDVIDTVLEPYYLDRDREAFLSLGRLHGNRKKNISAAIEEVYGKSREYVDPEEFLQGAIDVYCGDKNELLREDLRAFEHKKLWPLLRAEELARKLADRIALEHPGARHVSTIEKMADVAAAAYRQKTLEDAIDYLNDPANKIGTLSLNKEEKEQYAELYEYAKKEKEKIAKILSDVKKCKPISWDKMEIELSRLKPQVALLVEIVRKVNDLFTEEKKKRRMMDFSDMEHYALQLLSDPEVALMYRRRYEEILVDEYQDSNGVQEALIRAVCKNPEDPGNSNVFMVGDVKQSIYGFRRADPALFIEKFNRYQKTEKNGTLICLNSNYRSRRGILSGINTVFEKLMTIDRGGIVYDATARLNPGADYPDEEERFPCIIIETVGSKNANCEGENTEDTHTKTATERNVPSAGPKVSESDFSDSERGDPTPENKTEEEADEIETAGLQAVLIGQRIRQIVGKEKVFDLKTQGYHTATYRDIVVLMRSVKNAETQFLPILRDQFDIPCVTTEGAAYFEAPEVRDLIAFLRIIDNPLQDIPLAAVLSSPMFSLEADQLAKIRLDAPEADWFYMALCGYSGTDTELKRKIERFLEIFLDLRERSAFCTIPELLETILQRTDYRSKIGAMPGGRGREINVNMLLLKASDFEKTNYRGVNRFLRYIDRMSNKEIAIQEPNKLSDEDDVVRFMTIHKSKGLEFPIVFLADAHKNRNSVNRSGSCFAFSSDYRIAFDYVNPLLSVKIASNLKMLIMDRQEEENLYEEARVLYVAMTRAKEKLYVIGCEKDMPDPEQPAPKTFTDEDFFAKPSYLNWILRSIQGMLERTDLKPEGITYKGGDFALIRHPQAMLQKEYARMTDRKSVMENAAKEKGTSILGEDADEVEINDDDALSEIVRRFSFVYPYAVLGDQKAIVSVSEVKHRFMEEEGVLYEDVSRSIGSAIFEQTETDENGPAAVSGISVDRIASSADLVKTEVNNAIDLNENAEEKTFRIQTEQEENLGALRGTATHNVMEHLDFIETMEQEDRITYLLDRIDALTEEGILDATMQRLVDPRKISKFFDSRLATEMTKAQERNDLKREIRFLYAIPVAIYLRDYQKTVVSEQVRMQPDQVLVRGIIDAYYKDEDGHYVIMDYKTDALPENGGEDILSKRYLAQLKLYKEALESMLGARVKACVLYSFSLGKEIEVPL